MSEIRTADLPLGAQFCLIEYPAGSGRVPVTAMRIHVDIKLLSNSVEHGESLEVHCGTRPWFLGLIGGYTGHT